MLNRYLRFLILALVSLSSCSKKIIPEKPNLSNTIAGLDTLPLSTIDIPVRIHLRPVYAIAEKEVAQVYTSPGFPYDFVLENCDTRYMYKFRRGPLSFSSSGSLLKMQFTGYYQMAGAQRVCSGSGSERSPVTPWSPTCTCGLTKGERRVNVAFSASFHINPDYHVQASINRLRPVPLDKCTVCFWGQDITATVMERLSAQLDDARKSMTDTLQSISLRPQFQQLWDILNTLQPVYNYGYLQVNPEAIRLSQMTASNDTLYLTMGLSARPVISQQKPVEVKTKLPDLSNAIPARGFNIYTDAYLHYDSISNILTSQLHDKRFDLEKLGKYIVVNDLRIYGVNNEKLILRVGFSGSESGVFYLTGRPVYDAERKMIEMRDLDYDIRTKDMLVRSAEWLFNKRILRELAPYGRFDLAPYEKMLIERINAQFKSELKPGIRLEGGVREITISKIYPFTENLVIRFHTTGDLGVMVNGLGF